MFSPSQAYYIINVEWEKFVDTHGKEVWLWIGQDKDVETAIAENRTPAAGNIRWRFLDCPHQPDTFYIVNDRHEAFLDTHGTDLSVWNNGGRGVPQAVAGNTSKHAGSIRWWVLDCPHQPGTFYIVNARHGTFLGADRGKLSPWSTSRDIADVIAENTSRYAANICWHIRPVLHRAGSTAQLVAAPLPQRLVALRAALGTLPMVGPSRPLRLLRPTTPATWSLAAR
uniref:Ricin B lectin domain-containing protein n=1 Tax=Alexandrium monilatum TaxID=311494 RepID=A0A7S4RHV3_9DINO